MLATASWEIEIRPSGDDSEEAASTAGLDHDAGLEVAAQMAFCTLPPFRQQVPPQSSPPAIPTKAPLRAPVAAAAGGPPRTRLVRVQRRKASRSGVPRRSSRGLHQSKPQAP